MFELIGIIASIFLIISMSFKSTSFKTNMLMRLLTICGNVLFVIYGILITAWSTAICNAIIIIINIINIILLFKDKKPIEKQ